MTLASLPIRCFGHHMLAEISVHPQALSWEFQLYILSGTIFRLMAQPSRLYISHTFYGKHLAMWNMLNFAVSLRGIFRHWVGTVMTCWLWLTFEMDRTATEQSLHYAPFTPGGDCRATGHDSANRQWSLVVAPSPRLVANLRGTVSKRHGNEKIIFISATKWTVARLSGIVETQLRHSRVGVAWLICKKNHYGSVAERCECTTTMSQLSPNSGVTNGDCKGEMASVRDNGQQIMMTLPQHLN